VSKEEDYRQWVDCTFKLYSEVCTCVKDKYYKYSFFSKCFAYCSGEFSYLNQSVVPTVTTDIPLVSSANFLVIGVASVMPFFLTFF